MLKTVAFCLLAAGLLALEVRLLGSEQARTEEVNSVRLTINANGKYIYPHHPNTFALPALPSGKNVVEVISPYEVYPLLMVESRQSGNQYRLVHPFTRLVLQNVSEPIYLKPIDRLQFLFEEPGFSITGFLFSGTGLFLMFGVGMYLCYNKLMPKLEEAQLAPESAQAHRQ